MGDRPGTIVVKPSGPLLVQRQIESPALTGLADYVGRMKEGQKAIYTISGDSIEALMKSPQLEGFRAKGVEVLLLTDPVDAFWTSAPLDFGGKPLKSLSESGAKVGSGGGSAVAWRVRA